MLNRVLSYKIDHRYGPRLIFARSARDPLFDLAGVRGEVTVNNDAGILQVQTYPAGVRAEEYAALRVTLEYPNFRPAPLLWHAARMPGVSYPHLPQAIPGEFKHPFPL